MTVVLSYTGVPSQRASAEAQLRRTLGDVALTRKTSDIFEALLDNDQLQTVERDPNWTVVTPSYAEIRKPDLNLSKIRDKLAGSK